VNQLPELGNLAWAPVPAIERVEVLDRFNGVPTLGIFNADGERTLFWRALGYVPTEISIWLYVPMTDAAERHVTACDPSDVLTGPLFQSPVSRYVAVGVTDSDYRITFEREWNVAAGRSAAGVIDELLDFLLEAFNVMLEQDLPPTRREMMVRASHAVRELVTAGG
jgi:hypothetical protein